MEFSKPGRAYEADLGPVQERIAYKKELFNWCLRNAKQCMGRGRLNDTLVWCDLAARALSTTCSPLVSEELERILLHAAACIPIPEWRRTRDPGAPRRWLHVLDRAVSNGGHTATVRRWILSDPESLHNIALPYQELPVPEALLDTVRRAGGEILMPEPGSSLLRRAEWLRGLAFAKADYVVLHVANHSVVSPAAFGVDGGPPVLFNNHAAHVFWTGAPVIDLVLNTRGSDLERQWTEAYRAIPRSAILPLPIPAPEENGDGEPFSREFRSQARRTLGIPADAIVLLTVGREPKYHAIPGVDFIQVAHSVLSSNPNTYLLVVGPSVDARWNRASQTSNGRIIPTGRQLDLSPYHAAADIYMEGFPFGSTTALLEAGLHGIPCVLAPAECPPPFTTDGLAVDHELQRPASIAAYIEAIQELIRDPMERCRRGRSLARAIRSHHSGLGWHRYLVELFRHLPESHTVHPVHNPQTPPQEIEYFWETFMMQFENNELPFLVKVALLAGVTPWIDLRFHRAYFKARMLRHREGRLQFFLMAISNLLLPLCPPSARLRFYERWMSMACEEGLVPKVMHPIRSFKRLAMYFAGANS